jgi:hypothetical protein
MKKILISLSIVSLISVSILFFILLNNGNKNKITMNDENKNELIESNNSIKEEEEILDESITDISENIESDSSVIHNDDVPSNKNNKKVNNSSNTNVVKKQEKVEVKPEEPIKVEEPKQEEVKEEKQEEIPKPKEEVRDDIVDTNSFFYSIHHGKIEMSSQNKCLSAGEEIAFLDTVDINYYRCYEVTSTTGKVLGYYLNIFCNSDNCNRYKNQINMSKYK